MQSIIFFVSLASQLLVGLLPASSLVLAHGNEAHGHNLESIEQHDAEYAPSYFTHPDHVRVIYAHISLMVVAWVFSLPVAVILSLAKSRYALPSQFLFILTNSLGLVLGTIYNAQTPDLYPNNAHHHVGWVVTWIVSAHAIISLVRHAAVTLKLSGANVTEEEQSFIPTTARFPVAGHPEYYSQGYRLSNDSGQGSEPNTESLRSSSMSTLDDEERHQLQDLEKDLDEDESLNRPMPLRSKPKAIAVTAATKLVCSRAWKYMSVGHGTVDRIILPLGFIALTTGIATFGRFFEGDAIFSGLAHWIKGGVFFWLGIMTLGRWAGSFADFGWAWNLRPRNQSGRRWVPSAEFVESALIFVYGSTNIFLEHLGSTDGTWSSQDLEHISITVLFLGGGMCGMLVESIWVRDFLNTKIVMSESDYVHSDEEREVIQPPETYEFSMNPMPSLVILLLGIMMGGHEQESMISSMVHKQWGDLLLGASFARGMTYLIMFLKPPKSLHPSRPPTELLAAFGLIAGGIVFMSSSSDTIQGMIHYNLDAMSIYTVTLGISGLLMAWELLVLALKGWAIRREQRYREGAFL